MAKNPILFPDTFADYLSRLPVGRFGDEGATTAWVKQLIVEMFYGRGVPLFSFGETTISWGDGFSYFAGTPHAISEASHSFESLDAGWYYVYAEQVGGAASVFVSGSPPNLSSQQLWWNVKVESGLITEVIPAKFGFGI